MPNRWVIAIAGTVVMVTIGCLYSWALFTQPLLVAYHWDLRTTTWAYAIANFSLAAVGAVVGGFWQDQAGPRKVAMVGVALWGSGNVLAGLGTSAFGAPWLYATYGIMGGIGAGMAYITPVAMVTKWFPDRKASQAAWSPPDLAWAPSSITCWCRASRGSTPLRSTQAVSSPRKRPRPRALHPIFGISWT